MQKNKKLFLIDGMALIYRAYYAMIKNPLTDSSGLNTSAIYGFFNSLIKLLKNENPEYISVILDTKASRRIFFVIFNLLNGDFQM